ncbi:MAG: hypothetical protein CM1200mP1_01270 [Candidatus Neomarinimicrobiota bacterium]|nr:MAG: hypothetical protein CM1200mP1_01270 [Candidatus Neomarinimicrobiota bacterium]
MRINNILTKSIFIGLMALTFLGATERFKEELFKAMEYRNIGPFRGGRSAASTGVPGNKFLAYFGATGGGFGKQKMAVKLGTIYLMDILGDRLARSQ